MARCRLYNRMRLYMHLDKYTTRRYDLYATLFSIFLPPYFTDLLDDETCASGYATSIRQSLQSYAGSVPIADLPRRTATSENDFT